MNPRANRGSGANFARIRERWPQNTHDHLADRPRFYMELFQEKGRNVGTGHGEMWFNRQLARFEAIYRPKI